MKTITKTLFALSILLLSCSNPGIEGNWIAKKLNGKSLEEENKTVVFKFLANNVFSMSSSFNSAHGTWAHSPENKEIVMVYSISDPEGNQISQTVTWTNVELNGDNLSVSDPAGSIELVRE